MPVASLAAGASVLAPRLPGMRARVASSVALAGSARVAEARSERPTGRGGVEARALTAMLRCRRSASF